MLRFAIVFCLGFGLTSGALASGGLSCSGADGVKIHIGMGHVPVAGILSTEITADGKTWSTEDDSLAVGQAFWDLERFIIDYTDSNIEGIIVRVRLFSAEEGDDFVMAGILQIAGTGAYALVCDEFE